MRAFIDIVESTLLELTPYRGSDEFKAFDPLRSLPNDFSDDSFDRRSKGLTHFIQMMAEKGYKSIGRGVYGCVFEHPSVDYAIKLFKADPPYLAYVKFALAHQDSPYVPKFRGKFMKIDEDHYVVRMEKLAPIDRSISLEINGAANAIFYKELSPDSVEDYDDVFEIYPGMKELLESISALCRKVGASLDLHGKNIMCRGAEPVIIDPIRRRS